MAVEQINVQDLRALGDDILLIDVREDHEWADARAPHATHLPLDRVPATLGAFVGEPTYVICKAGGRSQHACEFAAANGKHVVNVAGGMLAWQAAGYPTESGR